MPYKDREYANAKRRTGRPPGPPQRPIAERFWPKVDQRGPDDCWPWLGGKTPRGYGHIGQYRGFGESMINRQATQVSWEIANGRPWPIGMEARHTCDNPPCVNPRHIQPGTSADNGDDMRTRGRSLAGERNPMYGRRAHSRLTDEQVREIRRAHGPAAGYRRLAKQYGVDRRTIARLLTGESYRDVA